MKKFIKLYFFTGLGLISLIFFIQIFNIYVLRGTKAELEPLTISYTTSTIPVQQNTEFNIGVALTTQNADKKISAVDISFRYDSDNKDLIEYQSLLQQPENYFDEKVIEATGSADQAKTLHLVLVSKKPDAQLGNTVLLNLRFKTKTTDGQTGFSITGTPQVSGPVSDNYFSLVVPADSVQIGIGAVTITPPDITPTLTPTATPPPGGATNTPTPTPTATPPPGGATNTPTPTPLPGGSAGLSLKVKFQGITAKPPAGRETINASVVVIKGSFEARSSGTVTFIAQDGGIWTTGPIAFSEQIPVGTGYTVYIKGDKHIQKKVCVNMPTETNGGTYRCTTGNINLVAGNNDLDFSGILQMAGDLPVQDGVVNSYDVTLVRNLLGKTDADSLRVADINKDGIVNTQDYSLIIFALSYRYDEE